MEFEKEEGEGKGKHEVARLVEHLQASSSSTSGSSSGSSTVNETIPPSCELSKSPLHAVITEVCLDNIESVQQAIEGGVSSVELCCDRTNGGVTPSVGLIRQCAALAKNHGVELHVLIRPRPGDFVYNEIEFQIIRDDVIAAKACGANVVFGALTADGSIDMDRMSEIRRLSTGTKLTFHRAFDMLSIDKSSGERYIESLSKVLKDIAILECDRLLTSGFESSASSGMGALRSIVEIVRAEEYPYVVVAAAGVKPQNAREILLKTCVGGLHAGSSLTSSFSNEPATSSNKNNVESRQNSDMLLYERVDSKLVREFVEKTTQF